MVKINKLFRLTRTSAKAFSQFVGNNLFSRGFYEKNSVFIGGILIVLSLIGGTLLILKKGTQAESSSSKENNDQKTLELENKIADLEKQITELKSAPAPAANLEAVTSPSSNSDQPVGKININSASQTQLESLPGIGPTYAKRIIEYRTANGGFKSINQIKNVKGIGEKTFAKFKDLITI